MQMHPEDKLRWRLSIGRRALHANFQAGLFGYTRVRATELIAAVPGSEGLLEELVKENDDKGVSQTAFKALIDRQHRATIERSLSELLTDDEKLKAGETNLPEISPLDWLGRIREDFARKKLVQIRAKALSLGLPNMSQVATVALKRVNPDTVFQVITDQLAETPPAWRRGVLQDCQRVSTRSTTETHSIYAVCSRTCEAEGFNINDRVEGLLRGPLSIDLHSGRYLQN